MRKVLLAVEVGAWCLGLLCCATLLVVRVQAHSAQEAALHLAARDTEQVSSNSREASVSKRRDSANSDGVMGRLEIQSIGLTVPILDDYDPSSLRKGVGHIQGTALPGGLGNMALAGHRDTFFRPLRNIQKGMNMSVLTAGGRYDYVVDSTTVVEPEEVSVVAIHDAPEMTLITCYPFDFVGAAPHRFIVRAHLRSLEPVSNSSHSLNQK
jgi:sortase A